MPAVAARGRKPNVRACGCCHRAEGTGGPENASLAGLSTAYIVQQMADFKSGARKFSGPPRAPVVWMIEAAKAASDAEVKSAATYFSALQLKPNISIVETNTVPRSYTAEPLGHRIIETPVDVEQFELRDSRAQFRAYVPVGSVARGATLVKSGGAGSALMRPVVAKFTESDMIAVAAYLGSLRGSKDQK
jgi:cytochrome c553